MAERRHFVLNIPLDVALVTGSVDGVYRMCIYDVYVYKYIHIHSTVATYVIMYLQYVNLQYIYILYSLSLSIYIYTDAGIHTHTHLGRSQIFPMIFQDFFTHWFPG